MKPKTSTLTDLELEIMQIVWGRRQATVRDVYETLRERRKVAYTTVMTMMKILEQKKRLKRTLVDRAYLYRPTQPQRQVVQAMVREFLQRVFNGSAAPLLLHLVRDRKLTSRDLEEISRLIGKKS
ncbi:MAG: BlaI/MecI/CopY family transcriptional regulator [Acidobacteriia bacterium]|nr:BlaI/MecI/CopY family transcriptional regulator [Terriglobia bacterium]